MSNQYNSTMCEAKAEARLVIEKLNSPVESALARLDSEQTGLANLLRNLEERLQPVLRAPQEACPTGTVCPGGDSQVHGAIMLAEHRVGYARSNVQDLIDRLTI